MLIWRVLKLFLAKALSVAESFLLYWSYEEILALLASLGGEHTSLSTMYISIVGCHWRLLGRVRSQQYRSLHILLGG